MRPLLIIPTYNERENIREIIPAIFAAGVDVDILVVDDSSPDGTAEEVRRLAQAEPRVNLLLRTEKAGLAKAYLAGFHWGLERGYSHLIEMDADFSHRPIDLKKLVENRDQADFVIGSRYIEGGGTSNWSFFRKLISRGGSLYARWILGYPLNDWTGGFNLWSRRVLEGIHLPSIHSEGYSFQIELKYKALRYGFRGLEVPILFEERREGQSKMSSRIVLEAFYRVWQMRFSKLQREPSA